MKVTTASLSTAVWYKNDTGEIMEKKVMEVSDIQRLYKLAQQLDLPLDVLSDNVVLQLLSAPGSNPCTMC